MGGERGVWGFTPRVRVGHADRCSFTVRDARARARTRRGHIRALALDQVHDLVFADAAPVSGGSIAFRHLTSAPGRPSSGRPPSTASRSRPDPKLALLRFCERWGEPPPTPPWPTRFCTPSHQSASMPGACSRCGSTLLQHVSSSEGEFAFEEAAVECLHCGHTGEPKHFRTNAELENFRLQVRQDR